MQKSWISPARTGLRSATQLSRNFKETPVFRRGIQDVSITRTGRPIIRIQGGRWVLAIDFLD